MVSTFLTSVNSLGCISMANKECNVKPETLNVNRNDTVFYPFSLKTSKFSCSCNNMNEWMIHM